jgi:5-aminolevulinate synthase
MDYESFFKQRVDALRAEGRYHIFADLERRCGRFPRAYDHRIGAEVTVWWHLAQFLQSGRPPRSSPQTLFTFSDLGRDPLTRFPAPA